MYGQFFHQLIKDMEKRCAPLTSLDRKLVDLAVKCLQKRARRRATEALVNGMGAQKRYHFDTGFRHAIDLFVNIVVSASFGDLPTGVDPAQLAKDFELLMGTATPKLQGQATFAKWIDECMAVTPDEVKEAWLSQHSAQATELTVDTVVKAVEQIKQQYYGPGQEAMKSIHPAYGPVTMGSAPKSGLQGTKTWRFSVKEPEPEPAPTEAKLLDDLLKTAQEKAKKLEEEQTAKEMGIPLKEAKKKYPSIFGGKGSMPGLVLADGDEVNITYTYTTE